MQNTEISWTDNTFNLAWGCVEVSPACDHCYAKVFAGRRTRKKDMIAQMMDPNASLWGRDARRLLATEDQWQEPLKWNRRAERKGIRELVFCGSMHDVMEDHRELTASRYRLFDLIEKTPFLDWQLTTKRPQNFKRFLPKSWLKDVQHNVWLLTTVESQDYVWRIAEMMKVPASVYGVSCEPLLSDIQLPKHFLNFGSSAWVICGGESGNRKTVRKPNVDWFRSLRDQALAHGVPYHFKQWGSYNSDLVMIGKKNAGCELDGQEYKQFPLGVVRPKGKQTR